MGIFLFLIVHTKYREDQEIAFAKYSNGNSTTKHMEDNGFSAFVHEVLHKYDDDIGKCVSSTTSKRDIFDEVVNMITTYIEIYDDSKKLNILECVLAQNGHRYHAATVNYIAANNDFAYPGVTTWLNKTLLYVTKYLSERETLSDSFFKLLHAMTKLLSHDKASKGAQFQDC